MSELNLPSDPMILLSFINTKLRDFYPSLDALCEDANISKDVYKRQKKDMPIKRLITTSVP